jgi:hypothetical protein
MKLRSNGCDDRPLEAKPLNLGKIQMSILVTSCMIVLCSVSALADDVREQVRVIGGEQAKTSYGWQVPGRTAVSCYGSGCSRYYTPSGTTGGSGAVLRLLRSDASIVVVQCMAQGNGVTGKAQGARTKDANSAQTPNHCTMPDASYQVAAEFHPREVKLYMFAPSATGPGAISSETYSIVGVLVPTSLPHPVDPDPAPVASPPVPATDSERIAPADANPNGKMAMPRAIEEGPATQAVSAPRSRVHDQLSSDVNSSPALLTYLTHELIDPRKPSEAHPGLTAAQEALLRLGPVRPAIEAQAPAPEPLQQEPPQAVPTAQEQAPAPQGQVDAAVAPVPTASGPALSAPTSLPKASEQAPLREGPVDTALAPSTPASTIALSAPRPLPLAPAQAPSPEGSVDAALASIFARPAPPPASVQSTLSSTSVPPVRAQVFPLAVPPAQATMQQARVSPPPTSLPTGQARVTPIPSSAPAAQVPVNQALPGEDPVVPARISPVPSATKTQLASSVPSVPATPVEIYPTQRPARQAASQFAAADRAPAVLVRIDPETGAAIPVVRESAPLPELVTQVASAGSALSGPDANAPNSSSDNPRFMRLQRKIADMDFPVQELADQWAQFERECPEPTTNAMCLDAKAKVILSMQKVFESEIVLIDQKIAVLEAGPQDTYAQEEEASSKDMRERMKVALERFPAVLAHLNKTLADLRHAKEDE